jgi:predicted nucleic acid-binding protein
MISTGAARASPNSGHQQHIETVARDWPCPVDESVVRTAGSLVREHRRAHSGIDDADYLIAATSMILDAELLTMSVRHFPMLGGLRPAYRLSSKRHFLTLS